MSGRWEALRSDLAGHEPGEYGTIDLAEVAALLAERDALREALADASALADTVLATFTVRGSIGAIDSHLRSSLTARRVVEEWRERAAAARAALDGDR